MVDTEKSIYHHFCVKIKKGDEKNGKEKLALVKRTLADESLMSLEREKGIYHAQLYKWTKQYLEGEEEALLNKCKPDNPLAKY